MHRVSLEHMGTFLRLLDLKRCYSVISHEDWDINWYFSLPLLLLHILCTTSDRGARGQTKKEMKYSLAKEKGYKDEWYHSSVMQGCCMAWSAACRWAVLLHLSARLPVLLPLLCCGASDKDDTKPFHPENPNAWFSQGFSSLWLEREVLCQSLAVLWERESKE